MKIGHFPKLLAAAIGFLIVNVTVSVLWVAVYAYLINPGHPAEFYQAYAQTAAPYSSIFAGMPLMFLMCWWLSRRWTPALARKSAWQIWSIYAAIDLAVLFASGMTTRLATFAAVSLITKLGAAVLGARAGAVARQD